MDEKTLKKLDRIDKLAEEDALYRYLLEELKEYEDALSEVERELSPEQRDVLWTFIMKLEVISDRKLTIACENMEFKGKLRRIFCRGR